MEVGPGGHIGSGAPPTPRGERDPIRVEVVSPCSSTEHQGAFKEGGLSYHKRLVSFARAYCQEAVRARLVIAGGVAGLS